MPRLELVSHHLCPYVQRAAVVLDEKGVAFERTYIDLARKPDWFRDLSPLGKVPLLRVGGEVLFESAVICDYLDETHAPRLHPDDPLERARHRAWVEVGSSILADIAGFYAAPDATALDARRDAIRAKVERLEGVVAGPYFVGERFSIVDAAFGPVFRYFDAFDTIADFGILDGLERVGAWRAGLARRPSVRRAVTEDYPERLMAFLRARDSHLGARARHKAAAPAGARP
ncbi:glutathione S-transferase family protein [Salinarimonas soli]|uniref:glutathione transferase n=1 Tax=Salinarimonas soli TaxID=1638099 RepID=A0A5B2VBI7_9HYPH|nr:glutathione S-transferase family protein [Salinarimonas soli]KAA2236025.1 glutathione S-transferase family protein [Salinarimonas soli]